MDKETKDQLYQLAYSFIGAVVISILILWIIN